MRTKFKNFIAILNQAVLHKKTFCRLPKNKFILAVVQAFVRRGYIRACSVEEYSILVYLRLDSNGMPIMRAVKFLGRSGYKESSIKWKNLPGKLKTSSDYLFSISSNGGLMWVDELYHKKLGGVVLLSVD